MTDIIAIHHPTSPISPPAAAPGFWRWTPPHGPEPAAAPGGARPQPQKNAELPVKIGILLGKNAFYKGNLGVKYGKLGLNFGIWWCHVWKLGYTQEKTCILQVDNQQQHLFDWWLNYINFCFVSGWPFLVTSFPTKPRILWSQIIHCWSPFPLHPILWVQTPRFTRGSNSLACFHYRQEH